MKSLVYLVTEQWWPPGKSEEVGKVFIEAYQQFPDDKSISKPIVQSAVWPAEQLMHSISVYSIQSGKVKEAMDIAYNRLLMFANAIEGWRYEINIAYDAVDAMSLIGLKPP